jgi:signal transduction histidine kinase/ActR/RegA family two-component response regulator
MEKTLSFSNWSLKKAKDTQPDGFSRARVSIVFTILLFSIIKSLVVISVAASVGQWLQMRRAVVAVAIYTILTKFLLYRPSSTRFISHIMIIVGILLICSNIFFFAHKINLITVQFVFMIAVSSFYILGVRFGTFYSTISTLPIIAYLLFHGTVGLSVAGTSEELASPGAEIIAILNFISLILSHYLFYKAINGNIKEKENLNQQLQLSIAEANRLAASKSNFLSTMSHELRTPLNSVIGISELLLEDRPEDRQKENLKILQLSAHDLLSLIDNVLDFNKSDSDKLELESIPFCLSDFMRNICAVLRVKANNKHLSLILDIGAPLEKLNVIGDPTRLSQVMYNLVGNAIKFTDSGSVTVTLRLIKKTEQEVDVLFSVADTGIGIHPDKHETIFEMFTQSESHIMRQYGGTGLGLPIVKHILTLFKSDIHLESSPGNGSKFFFTIPFGATAQPPMPSMPDLASHPDLRHMSILIAEDNTINRMVMKKQMEKLNIDPVMVENGQEAYDACLANHYDAILMDLHMPILGGYETIKQIRALTDTQKAKVHIIAFTASVTEQQEIMDSGFDDFLYKPVNLDELREKLEKIVLENVTVS